MKIDDCCALVSLDQWAVGSSPWRCTRLTKSELFSIGEGSGFFVFFGKQNESLASIEKRPRPYHKLLRWITTKIEPCQQKLLKTRHFRQLARKHKGNFGKKRENETARPVRYDVSNSFHFCNRHSKKAAICTHADSRLWFYAVILFVSL